MSESAPALIQPAPPPPLVGRAHLRPLLVSVVCVVVGGYVATWSGEKWDDGFPFAVAVMLLVALVAPLRRRFVAACDAIRHPSRRTRLLVALGLAVLAILHCWLQGIRVGRDMLPLWHDEYSYLLQSVQLAHGRLWYPAHPVADFFESFHLFSAPVYGSIYWPGTALMNAPGQWLGLPPWGVPMALYGASVAMIYLLSSRLLDGVAGLAAGLLGLVALDYDDFSTRIMAQMPVALLTAVLLWAWLRWRESASPGRRLGWVALIGACAGWMAITRPVDALVFCGPVGFALLGAIVADHVRGRRMRSMSADDRPPALWRPLILTVGVGVATTLPFLAVQLVQDAGMTGDPLLPPYVQYLRLNQPGAVFGEQQGIADDVVVARPTTTLPQKIDYYDKWLVDMSRGYNKATALGDVFVWRLPAMLNVSLSGRTFYGWTFLGALVALGVYGPFAQLTRDPRPRLPLLVMAAVVPMFLALYSYNPFFLAHYAIPVTILSIPLCVAGMRALEECAGPRVRPWLVTLLSGGVLIWFGWQVYTFPNGRYDLTNILTFKNRVVPTLVDGRALVLVYYGPTGQTSFHQEPVYNSDVPWPDDARIVWAHDLGGRDGEILRYYARTQPDRQVFLLIRPQETLIPMGRVPAALADFEAGRWPERDALANPAAATRPDPDSDTNSDSP